MWGDVCVPRRRCWVGDWPGVLARGTARHASAAAWGCMVWCGACEATAVVTWLSLVSGSS